jgi:ABC-type multidrug transport system fused ATPase/permease subunit
MKNIKKIWEILSKRQKNSFILLLLMTIVGMGLELLGVSAINPFVEAITNKQVLGNNESTTGKIYSLLGNPEYKNFLLILLAGLIGIYLAKNAYLLILYNFQFKFSYDTQRMMERELLGSYLQREYTFHLKYNSAELQRNIIQDVTGMYHTLSSGLSLITEGGVCLALFLYLLKLDKTITLGVVVFLALTFLVYSKLFGKRNSRIGVESRSASAKRVQWVQQSLGGIKEIKILGRESFFLKKYDENAAAFAKKQRQYQMAVSAPRPLMEAAGITALLGIIGFKLLRGVNAAYFIPTLSTFAVAAFRVLPSFGRISGAYGTIAFQKSAVEEVYNGIRMARKEVLSDDIKARGKEESLFLNKSIECKNVAYSYPESDKIVFKNVNITIPKNKSVAFIGPSGAGKTTLVDVILGILSPTEGVVLVDDCDIAQNIDAWHKMIGYIPQNIYLIDDSIRKNIAFGIDDEIIDDERIWQVLKEVQLYDFVKELDEGLDTYIGEGGARISGGQRQRIGIARALYTNPEVLVLDEATSALDSDTEAAIMDAINSLMGSRTMIIIAHRLTTVENCDIIYQVKNRKVVQTSLRKE